VPHSIGRVRSKRSHVSAPRTRGLLANTSARPARARGTRTWHRLALIFTFLSLRLIREFMKVRPIVFGLGILGAIGCTLSAQPASKLSGSARYARWKHGPPSDERFFPIQQNTCSRLTCATGPRAARFSWPNQLPACESKSWRNRASSPWNGVSLRTISNLTKSTSTA